MTKTFSSALAALCCFVLWGATSAIAQTSAVADSDQRDGTFKTVQGEVTVVHRHARSAAIVGGPVWTTDRIQTGADSAAALTLRDGTVLSVGPNSVVDLSMFQFDATTNEGDQQIGVLRGTLRMITGLIGKTMPERVQVTTPTTIIGVRGTDFIVEATP
jgi:hypothetical protein